MPTEWIIHAEAAALVGCHRHTIDRYVTGGRIARRSPRGRKTPSLNRASVEEFAKWWRARMLEAEQRRAQNELPPAGPPDDGDVWLDSITAGLVVGVSPQYLGRLAGQGRLPAAQDRRRRWFRRQHVEQLAAVRAHSRRREARQSA